MEAANRLPRHFTYVDHVLAGGYLSHFMDGLAEGGSQLDREGNNANLGINFGIGGMGLSGGVGGDASSEGMENFRHTPESIFERLYRILDHYELLKRVETIDDESWAEIRNGDFIEIIGGSVQIPDVIKALGLARSLDDLLPFLEMLETFGEIEITEDDRNMLGALRMFKDLGESGQDQNAGTLVATLPNASDHKFVMTLKKDFLKGKLQDTEGQATVLGRVHRKMREDDPPLGIEYFLPSLSEMMSLANSDQPQEVQVADEFSIGYPAATVIPVGIYL